MHIRFLPESNLFGCNYFVNTTIFFISIYLFCNLITCNKLLPHTGCTTVTFSFCLSCTTVPRFLSFSCTTVPPFLCLICTTVIHSLCLNCTTVPSSSLTHREGEMCGHLLVAQTERWSCITDLWWLMGNYICLGCDPFLARLWDNGGNSGWRRRVFCPTCV